MKPKNNVYILLLAGIFLPLNVLGVQNNQLPPQKQYIFDSTLRPRVFQYCADVIGLPVKPNRVIATRDLINLNNCVDKIIKNKEANKINHCQNCGKQNDALVFIDNKGQYHGVE